ncbi:MAG: hypothetical protein K5864_04260, partial [Bacteroidales bacterium]|nr:hypothetical protein [Bacteroidales bacterium]
YLLFQPFQCPFASLFFNCPSLGAKADAKVQPFSVPAKFFFEKNVTGKSKQLYVTVLNSEKNFAAPHKDHGKAGTPGLERGPEWRKTTAKIAFLQKTRVSY